MKFLTKADIGMKTMYKTKLSLLNYVIACITFFHLDISSVSSQTMDSRLGDSLALVALYNSTNGDDWVINDNWLSNKPIDEWRINNSSKLTLVDGRVTKIKLIENNLNGTIPPEIGNLTKLKELRLNGNDLSDTIPKEIGNLSSLQFLWLQLNQLSGEIPKEIGDLDTLYDLTLFDNELTGQIPSEMGDMDSLGVLSMQRNNLTGEIPKDFGNLSNLQALELGSNDLTGSIPAELGNCKRLSSINLYDNELTGSIPAELADLEFLTTLSLANNNLTGEIPERFSEIKYMSTMDLGNNNLSGSISPIGNFKYLNHLRLYGNNFSGNVPAGIFVSPKLLQVWLANNQLDYIEPINSVSSKTEVKLNNNKIGFASIAPNIDELNTYNNQIIDGRDTLIGVETRDIALTISDVYAGNSYQWYKDGNVIDDATESRYVISNLSSADAGKYYASITNSGFDPAKYTFWRDTIYVTIITLREADSLALVDLYNSTNGPEWEDKDNWLTVSPIDTWEGVVATDRVNEIDLEGSNLVGVISSIVGELDKLRRLDLSNNNLMGSVPLELANLSDLVELRLNDNNLTGTIPSGLGDLENLEELRLNNNSLTGTIPSGIRKTLMNLDRITIEQQ